MSAQEELEKLHADIDATAFLANRVGDHRYSAQLREWADRIAAIREGFGKAQGEAVAAVGEPFGTQIEWLADHIPPKGTKLYVAPPADSAQASMDALLLAGNGLSNAAHNLSQFDVIAADYRAQLRNAAKKWDDAIAAHKSEVKG